MIVSTGSGRPENMLRQQQDLLRLLALPSFLPSFVGRWLAGLSFSAGLSCFRIDFVVRDPIVLNAKLDRRRD
jgi:hypothetical protein